MEEVETAEKAGETFVLAICPKCGEGYTSLIHNAKNTVTHGCICCSDAWEPVIGVQIVRRGADEGTQGDPH